jgi:hypothetical protein
MSVLSGCQAERKYTAKSLPHEGQLYISSPKFYSVLSENERWHVAAVTATAHGFFDPM